MILIKLIEIISIEILLSLYFDNNSSDINYPGNEIDNDKDISFKPNLFIPLSTFK